MPIHAEQIICDQTGVTLAFDETTLDDVTSPETFEKAILFAYAAGWIVKINHQHQDVLASIEEIPDELIQQRDMRLALSIGLHRTISPRAELPE